MRNNAPVVLSIDPGYDRLGVAVMTQADGVDRLLHSERFTTPRDAAHHIRLSLVEKHLAEVIAAHHPTCIATETLFFSKNRRTALKVAEVRGVILATAANHALPFFEYGPAQIKIAITGHGKSDKKQMLAMVPRLLPKDMGKIGAAARGDDEIDAIAIGLTHLACRGRT